MLRSPRALWAAALLLPLVACDYSYSPGVDSMRRDSFAAAPRATHVDTDRDSMSGGGKAYRPVGTTSGARSTAEAVSSQPGGDPNTSKYTSGGTTDGTSTTSGQSLTRGGASPADITSGQSTEKAASGTATGQTTGGRGTLNNAPRTTDPNASQRRNAVGQQQ
ncbi:hypothetical protein F0P96_04680 [Hymenobacter busanensis]|uniref:Uncharacterized protein n=1 Tax=Hymenobacter busanensis TaxID=2607656 RepID=A0A7L5A1N5_9BACT|nr:hypothetical protein [Hymenobacter busanensis]KAA9338148.1 hypothetical protein F0P96_04680 [Hymenobacter busanensis]QHJ09428.1 hypothetical protein GUY19_19930 [Hymenobacter busanensis]